MESLPSTAMTLFEMFSFLLLLYFTKLPRGPRREQGEMSAVDTRDTPKGVQKTSINESELSFCNQKLVRFDQTVMLVNTVIRSMRACKPKPDVEQSERT